MNTSPVATSAFRATFVVANGKCPPKKDNKPGFKAWRSSFRKAITAARTAGTVLPKGACRAGSTSAAMLAGKPFTHGMARRMVETLASVYDPVALRTALEASGYTFTAVDGSDETAPTVWTIAETPKTEKVKAASVQVNGHEFTKRDAASAVKGLRAAFAQPASKLDDSLKAALAAHGYTCNADGSISDPDKVPETPAVAAPEAPKVPETPAAPPAPPASGVVVKPEAKAAVQPAKRGSRAAGKAGE